MLTKQQIFVPSARSKLLNDSPVSHCPNRPEKKTETGKTQLLESVSLAQSTRMASVKTGPLSH